MYSKAFCKTARVSGPVRPGDTWAKYTRAGMSFTCHAAD